MSLLTPYTFSFLLQELNIPVPDAVPVNSYGDSKEDPPPTKKARMETTVSGTKVMALPSGIVNCNAPICDLIKIVKPVIRALVEDCKYYHWKVL